MKKDCALILTFIGFLYLYVSLSFLVTRTLPVPPQTISLLTKCTNEMSPPTAGWEDWCARTFFFTLFEFSFPALSLPHTFIIDFFFLSSISQHWKLNFWPSLFVTQTICNLYAYPSTKYSIMPLLSKYYSIKRCNISENKANYCFSTFSEIFITILLTVQKP